MNIIRKEKNKILILSTINDRSTTNVMRWIFYLAPELEVIRLHPEDLIDGSILQKWFDFFVLHKDIEKVIIKKELT